MNTHIIMVVMKFAASNVKKCRVRHGVVSRVQVTYIYGLTNQLVLVGTSYTYAGQQSTHSSNSLTQRRILSYPSTFFFEVQ